MVKVSITLPNTAQITFEAEEAEIIHGVVGIVLRDLPPELTQRLPADGGSLLPTAVEKGTSVASAEVIDRPDMTNQVTSDAPITARDPSIPPRRSAGAGNRKRVTAQARPPQNPPPPQVSTQDAPSAEQQAAFSEFCRSANPLGDMRRVVVATEGASRILGYLSVDAEDLAALFDLAGWRRPHNFTQTLRNAARDKFRWLERVPGRTGKYAATSLGRSVTLGE